MKSEKFLLNKIFTFKYISTALCNLRGCSLILPKRGGNSSKTFFFLLSVKVVLLGGPKLAEAALLAKLFSHFFSDATFLKARPLCTSRKRSRPFKILFKKFEIAFFLKRFPVKQIKFFSDEKNRHELAL